MERDTITYHSRSSSTPASVRAGPGRGRARGSTAGAGAAPTQQLGSWTATPRWDTHCALLVSRVHPIVCSLLSNLAPFRATLLLILRYRMFSEV